MYISYVYRKYLARDNLYVNTIGTFQFHHVFSGNFHALQQMYRKATNDYWVLIVPCATLPYVPIAEHRSYNEIVIRSFLLKFEWCVYVRCVVKGFGVRVHLNQSSFKGTYSILQLFFVRSK